MQVKRNQLSLGATRISGIVTARTGIIENNAAKLRSELHLLLTV